MLPSKDTRVSESADDVDAVGEIADFVVNTDYSRAPVGLRAVAYDGVIDFWGCAIGGLLDDRVGQFADYLAGSYGSGASSALGLADTVSACAAAYANSTAAHALDFDDILQPLGGHPSAIVLPAVMAMAEPSGVAAAKVLDAYVTGVEVAGALGACLNLEHYERGWHPTATLGIFGAVAGCCRIMGCDTETVRSAMSIAASFSSGIKSNFGTFMKPIQVGAASSAAVTAAELAARGLAGGTGAFVGPQSFPAVYNGKTWTDEEWRPLSTLGESWRMIEPGLVFKLYPCCGSMHSVIDAALQLRAQGLRAEDLTSMRVLVHPRRAAHTNRPSPRTSLEGRYSLQFAASVAILKGRAGVDEFNADVIASDDIQRLLSVTSVAPLEASRSVVLPGESDSFSGALQVVVTSGEELEVYFVGPKGSDPDRPITRTDVEQKCQRLMTSALGSARAAEAFRAVSEFAGGAGTASDLMGTLRAVQGGSTA